MAFFILLVVLLKSIGTLSNVHEYFNITRRPSANYYQYYHDKMQDLPDLFQLPPSLCGESKGTIECPLMGGRKIGDCQCACDMKDDKGVTYKSTFGFYDGEWKCVNNSALRRDTGCLSVLYGDISNTPIPTFGKSYTSWRIENRHNRNRCHSVRRRPHYNSSYQNCNGTWEFFNKSVLDKNFLHFRSRHLSSIYIRFHPSQAYPLPSGRLIKLVFECYVPKPAVQVLCFLFKEEGNLKCPLPSITSPSPIITVSSSSSTSSERISTSVTANSTNSTIKDSNYSSSSTKTTSWLIAGSTSGAIVFIIVITVIVVIVTRKRKRKKEERKRERYQQTAQDRTSDAIYVTQGSPDFNISNELEYENIPNVAETDELKAIKQLKAETSEALDSTTYCSLVGNEAHVYGSLKGPHKTHEEETDRQVTCLSQNKETDNTYQELNTFCQQDHSEYQQLKYKKGKEAYKKNPKYGNVM